jgi:hypothetical protein
MFAQLLGGEELMLVCEDLLVPGTQVAHDLLVLRPNVTVKVRPAQASFVAARIRAVVAQKYNSVLKYLLLLVAYAHVSVVPEELISLVVLESLFCIIREDNCRCFCTAMRASFRLVKRSQA